MRVDETIILKVRAKTLIDLLETVDEVLRNYPYEKKPHNLLYALECHKDEIEGILQDD